MLPLRSRFHLFTAPSSVAQCSDSSDITLTELLSPELDLNFLFLFSQSGSQGNLCDSWAEDGGHGASPSPGSASPGGLSSFERRSTSKVSTSRIRAMPAEYPFQANLSMPQSSVNFDLTHKRGKFSKNKNSWVVRNARLTHSRNTWKLSIDWFS